MKIATVKGDNENYDMILIENTDDLNEYFQKIHQPKMSGAFEKVLKLHDKDLEEFVHSYKGENTLATSLTIEYLKGERGLLECSMSLSEKLALAKLNGLSKCKAILINPAGGWCRVVDQEILSVREEEFVPREFYNTGVF